MSGFAQVRRVVRVALDRFTLDRSADLRGWQMQWAQHYFSGAGEGIGICCAPAPIPKTLASASTGISMAVGRQRSGQGQANPRGGAGGMGLAGSPPRLHLQESHPFPSPWTGKMDETEVPPELDAATGNSA